MSSDLRTALPDDWQQALDAELIDDYWIELQRFIEAERQQHEVFPPESQVLRAFELTRFEDVSVVLLGQDPYHGPGQAHGMSFSVPVGVPRPPSVRKIHAELHRDLGATPPGHGNLEGWARQGVLLLNTTLTVRRGDANSHRGRGWERFTDSVITTVGRQAEPVVFLLWGKPAARKRHLIDEKQHHVIEAAHPAARKSAKKPLFGSSCFSLANRYLIDAGKQPVDWSRFTG